MFISPAPMAATGAPLLATRAPLLGALLLVTRCPILALTVGLADMWLDDTRFCLELLLAVAGLLEVVVVTRTLVSDVVGAQCADASPLWPMAPAAVCSPFVTLGAGVGSRLRAGAVVVLVEVTAAGVADAVGRANIASNTGSPSPSFPSLT